jgi:Protein of unknown function (DUF3667)
MKSKHCLNCEHTIKEKFCPACGQKTDTHKLDWHYVFHEVPHSFFHVEKGLFLTIKELTIRPGFAIRDFLDGRRARYFKPFTYLVLLGTIAGLISLYSPIAEGLANDEKTMQLIQSIKNFMSKYYTLFSAIFIPMRSLAVWIFHRKERNYVEIITINIFIVAHLSLLNFLGFLGFIFHSQGTLLLVGLIQFLIMAAYEIWVYSTVFVRRSEERRIFKAFLIVILNFLLQAVVIVSALAIYLTYFAEQSFVEVNFGIKHE